MYLNLWNNKTVMLDDFHITNKELDGYKVLFAYYDIGNYCGEAFVLLEDTTNQLYEVNASHGSYNGLKGQWCPESTTIEALLYRIENGSLGSDGYSRSIFKDDLLKVLNQLEAYGHPIRYL